MADAAIWDRLSQSARQALRWAGASAHCRGATGADGLDVLVGLLLTHGRASAPWDLLAHFRVAPGRLLAARIPPAAALAAAESRTGAERPILAPDVEDLLASAVTLAQYDPEHLVTFNALFGGLLLYPNAGGDALRSALSEVGAPFDQLAESYRDFLVPGTGFGRFLQERFPWPPPRQLPAYATDLPPTRPPRRPAEPGAGPETAFDRPDLVGVAAEVDAFAFLIASTDLAPPLAIGLFGDWGSGKSYFIRSLQRRVADVEAAARQATGPVRFHRGMVQIEFNAWQYVQGDLWASLLDHLLRNLDPPRDAGDPLGAERSRYLARIAEAAEPAAELRQQRAVAEEARRQAAAVLDRRLAERDLALATLHRQQLAVTTADTLRTQVKEVAQRAGVPAVVAASADLAGVLDEARRAARRATGVAATLQRAGWRLGAPAIAGLLLTPTIVWLTSQVDWSGAAQASAGVASLLATAAAMVRTGTRSVTAVLDDIDATEREVRAAHDAAVADAQAEVRSAEQAVEVAELARRDTENQVADLEAQLASLTPGRLLDDFLHERLGTDDYVKYLGLPAIVRRDLERLSDIITAENEAITVSTDDGCDSGPCINRIVLYIDDLDRCPTAKVIEVLQAVHLLLAFPVFVVVVAVDSRWLAGSLRDHYGAQLAGDGTASADDYLEKIFQIPFWVQPLDAAARRRMVRGLLAGQLQAAGDGLASSGAGETASPPTDADLEGLLAAMRATSTDAPEWLESAAMTVTPEELAAMDAAASLVGRTPRSVKRFVNVFQLVKAIGQAVGRPAGPPEPLVVLLALATGLPGTATALFDRLSVVPPPATLLDAATQLAPDDHPEFQAWLAEQPALGELATADLSGWLDLVRRFSFQTGSTAGGRTSNR